MNYNNILKCGPNAEDDVPDGTTEYVGVYKLSPENRANILPGRNYTYESCKNTAASQGKRVFGLSGFDINSQTAYCFLGDDINQAVDNYTDSDVYTGLNDGKIYSGRPPEASALYYTSRGRPWQCVDGVNIPIRINAWNSIECMSGDGQNCVSTNSPTECQAQANRPVVPNRPIICSQDKYNDSAHWCSRIRDNVRIPPGSYVNPNVYGNAKVPVPPTVVQKVLGLSPTKAVKPVKPRAHCCCPPPDPKIWMLRADLDKLLKDITNHPDYTILMDEYALKKDNSYATCKIVPGQDGGSFKWKALMGGATPNPACQGKKCPALCCPAPDPKKYIRKSEVQKLLGVNPIEKHPQFPMLMEKYAVKNQKNGAYMACKDSQT